MGRAVLQWNRKLRFHKSVLKDSSLRHCDSIESVKKRARGWGFKALGDASQVEPLPP